MKKRTTELMPGDVLWYDRDAGMVDTVTSVEDVDHVKWPHQAITRVDVDRFDLRTGRVTSQWFWSGLHAVHSLAEPIITVAWVREFCNAYSRCLAWCSTVEVEEDADYGVNVDTYMADNGVSWSMQAKFTSRHDCIDFVRGNRAALDAACRFGWWDAEQAGHDFALTRNGHGAGYWDRYYGEDNGIPAKVGDLLSTASKVYGETYCYVGTDDAVEVNA